MRKEFVRNSTVAILAAGLLAVAAVAQTGEASGQVKIEGGSAPAAKAQVKPAAKPAKPVIQDRDPFVNQVSGGVVNSSAVVRRRSSSTGASVRPASAASRSASAKAAVAEPTPEVTITGIVKSRGAHQAIVNSGTSSYIVVAGQKLGDYRVAAITDTAVTFTHSGKSFKIPIESDFGLKK